MNRADLLQAMGLYPPPPGESEILGLEMAGVVSAMGDQVKGPIIGERVIGLLAGGGYAQQAAVHPEMLLHLPDSWSFAQGAAIPEVWLTAFSNLFMEIGLLGGSTAEINLGAVLGKSLRIIGSRLRSRPLEQKIEITRRFADRFWPMFAAGRLQPVIDTVYPIQEVGAAHDYVRENKNTGKVILEVDPSAQSN